MSFASVVYSFTAYSTIFFLWLVALLQLAIIRDRTIYDTSLGVSARWLIVVGYAGLALRFTLYAWDAGHLVVPWYSLVSIWCIAFGMVVRSLERLLRREPVGHPQRRCTDWQELEA